MSTGVFFPQRGRRGVPRGTATGKNRGSKPPNAPERGPRPENQINLTYEESRIMPVDGCGFEQC